MLTFILVEDNLSQIKIVKELVNKTMMSNDRDYKIREFSDYTQELSDLIKDGDTHKIYVLDFELPSATAIDIAREIREYDWTSVIIVHSAHGSLAYETFKQRLQILDFVTKQFEAEKNLLELFKICLNQFDIHKPIVIKKRTYELRIFPQNVLYICKTEKRKVFIKTTDEDYEILGSLTEMKSLLGDDFIQTHKSCYVNMKRVRKIDWGSNIIYFDNQVMCDLISEHYKDEVEGYENN